MDPVGTRKACVTKARAGTVNRTARPTSRTKSRRKRPRGRGPGRAGGAGLAAGAWPVAAAAPSCFPAAVPLPSWPDICGRRARWRRSARWRLGPLPDPGPLAAQGAQVVELGPAHPAPADHFDLVDRRAVDREGALYPDAVTDLADGEGFPGTAALAPDDHALEDLDPGPAALDHP